MSKRILVRNRQRVEPIDARLLGKIARTLLVDLLQLKSFDLAVYILAAPEMTRLNESFLRHQGSTDVLAFDYAEPSRPMNLCGEIFVCLDEAKIQARRFRTTWPQELVRYVVHGVLHLRGYDDHRLASRRKMKREENRLLKALRQCHAFAELRV